VIGRWSVDRVRGGRQTAQATGMKFKREEMF